MSTEMELNRIWRKLRDIDAKTDAVVAAVAAHIPIRHSIYNMPYRKTNRYADKPPVTHDSRNAIPWGVE